MNIISRREKRGKDSLWIFIFFSQLYRYFSAGGNFFFFFFLSALDFFFNILFFLLFVFKCIVELDFSFPLYNILLRVGCSKWCRKSLSSETRLYKCVLKKDLPINKVIKITSSNFNLLRNFKLIKNINLIFSIFLHIFFLF